MDRKQTEVEEIKKLVQEVHTTQQLIKKDILVISDAMRQIRKDIGAVKRESVSKYEFEPIKKVVYGLVTVLLIGVVGAMLNLVVP